MRNLGFVAVMTALALVAVATDASASQAVVPEISPTTLSAGLALLAGGVLLVRARRRK